MRARTHPTLLQASVLLVLAVGCHPEESEVPSYRWVAGDPHVHSSTGSNDTDGVSFGEDIAEVAAARGLSWLVVTDHSNSAGSMHCEDVELCPNLGPEFPARAEAKALDTPTLVFAVGSELSPLAEGGDPNGHVGCLPPADGFSYEEAFIDRPAGAVTGTAVLDQCHEAFGWAVVNHPFAQARWIRWDWTAQEGMEAMEVWNGGLRWDAADETALWSWECLVARGQPVVPLAASDNHQARIEVPGDALNPALGQTRTTVRLAAEAELSWGSVREALAAGRVVLHEEDTRLEPVFLAENSGGTVLQVRGYAPSGGRVELRSIPAEAACDPSGPQGPLHSVLWSQEVWEDFDLDTGYPAPAEGDEATYLALTRDGLEPLMEGGIALSGLLSAVAP